MSFWILRIAWSIDWSIDRLVEWVSDGLSSGPLDRSIAHSTDWLNDWPINQMMDLDVWVLGWVIVLIDLIIVRSNDLLIDWLVDWLIDRTGPFYFIPLQDWDRIFLVYRGSQSFVWSHRAKKEFRLNKGGVVIDRSVGGMGFWWSIIRATWSINRPVSYTHLTLPTSDLV